MMEERWMSAARHRDLAVAAREARGGCWRAVVEEEEERIGVRNWGVKGGRWRAVRALESWATVAMLRRES